MVSGSVQRQGLIICIGSFTEEDVVRIIKVLKVRFNLDSTIHYNEEKPMIFIREGSMPLLRSIVSPYMFPSVKYKLYYELAHPAKVDSVSIYINSTLA